MGFIQRMSRAIRAGYHAYNYNEKALVPIEDLGAWDESRLFRYRFCDGYYNNIAYSSLAQFAAQHKSNRKLYKHIRSIYNPVQRIVDLYVAKVYGGALDMETLKTGAIPIVGADEALTNALRQLWIWSNWSTRKSLYVRYGALYGDTVIKIVDEPDKEKVRMEVLHPGRIKDIKLDSVGNVKKVVIEYERDEKLSYDRFGLLPLKSMRTYTYREEIDGDWFATFKNDEPFAFYNNSDGEPVSRWPNEYGFVPIVLGNHKDMGLRWGTNSFHGQVGKIDELNDAASLLNDQIRKVVDPLWYLAGVKNPGKELTAQKGHTAVEELERRDTLDLLHGPLGSQPYPMIAPIAIADALANIQSMLNELENDLPELALHRLREGGNLTAPGVEAGYSDAIGRITEASGNYNDALVRAQQMAVSIGGLRRYRGFEAFDLDSYADGDLEHYIGDRPVIKDKLSESERMQILQSRDDVPIWLLLTEMGFDQDTIDRVVADEEARTRNAVRGAMDSIFGDEDTDPDLKNKELIIDDEETEEEAFT